MYLDKNNILIFWYLQELRVFQVLNWNQSVWDKIFDKVSIKNFTLQFFVENEITSTVAMYFTTSAAAMYISASTAPVFVVAVDHDKYSKCVSFRNGSHHL